MKQVKDSFGSVLAGAVMLGLSSQAEAILVTDLGTLGDSGLSATTTTTLYAWDGLHPCAGINAGFGCGDQSRWYTFSVDSEKGVTINTTKSVTGHPLNMAFSLWKTTGGFVGGNHYDHGYSQIRADGGSVWLQAGYYSRDIQDPTITNGITEFVGYANSGPSGWTNPDGDVIGIGSGGTVSVDGGNASLAIASLAAGQYLLALGGSCHGDAGTSPCQSTIRPPVTLSISQTTAVPVPQALWLLGSALGFLKLGGMRAGGERQART
jgi:hypothetical protein